jgi:hypothetical protein
MDMQAIRATLKHQANVFSRSQVLGHGGNDNDIARMQRRREWAQVHPGVYVAHTGPITLEQREWAAILYYAPAALTGRSALRKYGVRTGRDLEPANTVGPVHIAVDRGRRLEAREGVMLTRVTRFDVDRLENYSPPRIRLEHVVLEVAASAGTEAAAVAVICDAVQSRRTTPARLLSCLDDRPRLRHRALLRRVLADVANGAYSVLEHEYLHRVERAHSLPSGARQRRVRIGRSPAYRDVEYPLQATIVELDGRLGHELTLDRWDDLERDIDALTGGSLTIRAGWAHVLEPCRLASAVARILLSRGWLGQPQGCSAACPAGQVSGAQPAPGAGHTPQIV